MGYQRRVHGELFQLAREETKYCFHFIPGCALQENLKMGKGQNEGGFSQEQLDMYKECFKLMDIDKDGTITKNDIRAAFDNVGKLMSEGELDDMLGEVGAACTFQAMIDMFQKKMAGGSNDPDDLIVRAFKAYESNGKIEAEMFRHALMNFGDKFNQAEIDDIFGEFEVDDDGFLESKAVIGLFVAGGGEEKKEEKKEEEAAPAADAPAEGGDGGGEDADADEQGQESEVFGQEGRRNCVNEPALIHLEYQIILSRTQFSRPSGCIAFTWPTPQIPLCY